MKTPAGKECRYFYADYFRGRNHQECRLLLDAPTPQEWTQDLCFNCPVPDILRANACPYLILEGKVDRPFPFLKKKVAVKAYCSKTLRDVSEPRIGCGECHQLPPVFSGEIGDTDSTG